MQVRFLSGVLILETKEIDMLTRVVNLSTGDESFYTLPAPEAVMCAYGAGQHNGNTWTYAEKYSHLVKYGASGKTVSCGDYSAMLKET